MDRIWYEIVLKTSAKVCYTLRAHSLGHRGAVVKGIKHISTHLLVNI